MASKEGLERIKNILYLITGGLVIWVFIYQISWRVEANDRRRIQGLEEFDLVGSLISLELIWMPILAILPSAIGIYVTMDFSNPKTLNKMNK